MHVLLSTIGSRGDVQPLVALASQLRLLGQDVRLCVPPDFEEWIEGFGFAVAPIGPRVRGYATAPPPTTPLSSEQRQQLMAATVATQFDTISKAAEDCDVIVAATALQVAARSIAETKGVPYVFAAYSPSVLPSLHHAPPPMPPLPGQPASPPAADNRERWARDGERFNSLFGPALNVHRTAMTLAPVTDVRSHMFTDHPWLAADPVLAPWPDSATHVVQTGAWLLPDDRPLEADVARFLERDDAPIYFGFGSTPAPQDVAVMIDAARAIGRRAIVSRGWTDLAGGAALDCLTIGEANLGALFRRVAVAVHHGGAGTTTAASLAGAPQVIVPMRYDQHYFANRVGELGIGVTHAAGTLTAESLAQTLDRALRPDVHARARSVAASMRTDGATIAARRLIELAG
jgi:vancomycin aglycone glucosyltransferase